MNQNTEVQIRPLPIRKAFTKLSLIL